MQQQFVQSGGATNKGLTLQLAGSYLLVGVVDLILWHWLSIFSIAPAISVVLTITCSMTIGLLVTANIQYFLFTLYISLVNLAEERSVEISQPTRRQWPLRSLFFVLASIQQRELLARSAQEQRIQQTSEAAAAEERNRLARELHDSIKQQLFSIRMSAIAAKAHVQGSQAKAQMAIDDIQRSANEAQIEMQALLQQLRPIALEHTTLSEAVQTQALALEYRSGLQAVIKVAPLPALERCPAAMQEAIFRIVQECFANIARHARARHVQCTIEADDTYLHVMIHDDGLGFDPQEVQKGIGLASIQERARYLNGTTRIESASGQGATIQVQVPLLLPLEIRQQHEQQELAIQKTVEQLYGWLQIRSTLAAFTVILLVIDLALVAIKAQAQTKDLSQLLLAACLGFMLYGLIRIHLAIVRTRLYYGENDPRTCGFIFHEQLGWINFIRLSIFALWHIIVWGALLLLREPWWQIGACFLVVTLVPFTIYVALYRRCQHVQNRFYALLSARSLHAEMKLRRSAIRWRVILFVLLAIPLLVQNTLLNDLTNIFWRWLVYYLLFIFLIVCLGIIFDIRQLHIWQVRTTSKTDISKG